MTDIGHRQTSPSKLGIAMVIFILWLGITMGAEVWQAGGQISLEKLVAERVVAGLVLAPAFLVAIMAWLRWDGLGLSAPAPWRSLMILWLPVLYLVAILMSAAARGFPPIANIAFILVNTALVGVSEELMFRGIMLRGGLSRLTLWQSIWLSCALFGLIHALNVFLTGQAAGAFVQALAAFLSGLFYTAVRIRTRSLYPMIIIHTLWDFSLFMGVGSGVPVSAPAVPLAMQVLAPVALVLPLFLYGLFLLRHAERDFGQMSESAPGQVK